MGAKLRRERTFNVRERRPSVVGSGDLGGFRVPDALRASRRLDWISKAAWVAIVGLARDDLTPGEVAAAIGVERVTMYPTIERLRAAGLLEVRRVPGNGRPRVRFRPRWPVWLERASRAHPLGIM